MKSIRQLACLLLVFSTLFLHKTQAQLTIIDSRNIENDRLIVSIAFTGSQQLLAMQGSFRFDSRSLRYNSVVIREFATLRLDDFSLENPSTLNILWIDPQFTGINLPENTTMFELHFDILNTRNTNIYFTNCPLAIEVINANDQVLNVGGNIVEDRFCTAIRGRVFQDINRDCRGTNEPGISGVFVEATGPAGKVSTITDAQGFYEIQGPTGMYSVRVFTPSPLWAACTVEENVTVNSFSFPRAANFYLQPEFDCPSVEVKVGAQGLNLCTENEINIAYRNAGTLALNGPFVLVKLPAQLELLEVSRPHNIDPDGSIRVAFNQLAPNEQGSFRIRVRTPCGLQWLGRSMCIEARGNPDDICLPPLQGWNGSNLRLTAECNNNIVRLRATNMGTNRMPTNIPLFIMKNDLQERFENIRLDPGESYEFQKQGDGATYTILTYQVPGFPLQGAISASVEACAATSNPARGFINQFPYQKKEAAFDRVCLEIADPSEFPPEKWTTVKGFGMNRDVHYQTRMEYFISFPGAINNKVLIIDTLTSAFDVRSISLGPSSHPVTFSIEKENILFFDVDLSQRPLSPLQRGYVSFNISFSPNTSLPFQANNLAWMYKDNDPPVSTNPTQHRAILEYGDFVSSAREFLPVDIKSLTVFPNPAKNTLYLDSGGIPASDQLSYRITSSNGLTVAHSPLMHPSEPIPTSNLSGGVYFLEVQCRRSGIVYRARFVKE